MEEKNHLLSCSVLKPGKYCITQARFKQATQWYFLQSPWTAAWCYHRSLWDILSHHQGCEGFRLVGLAIKNHHSKFPFPSAAPPPLCSSRQASLLLLPCPFLDFVLKPSQPPIHLWSFIWPLCIFQHNPTDSEPQFSFFFCFPCHCEFWCPH